MGARVGGLPRSVIHRTKICFFIYILMRVYYYYVEEIKPTIDRELKKQRTKQARNQVDLIFGL